MKLVRLWKTGATRHWAATKEGQEQIDLKHKIRATEKMLSSLKHRLYNYL